MTTAASCSRKAVGCAAEDRACCMPTIAWYTAVGVSSEGGACGGTWVGRVGQTHARRAQANVCPVGTAAHAGCMPCPYGKKNTDVASPAHGAHGTWAQGVGWPDIFYFILFSLHPCLYSYPYLFTSFIFSCAGGSLEHRSRPAATERATRQHTAAPSTHSSAGTRRWDATGAGSCPALQCCKGSARTCCPRARCGPRAPPPSASSSGGCAAHGAGCCPAWWCHQAPLHARHTLPHTHTRTMLAAGPTHQRQQLGRRPQVRRHLRGRGPARRLVGPAAAAAAGRLLPQGRGPLPCRHAGARVRPQGRVGQPLARGPLLRAAAAAAVAER